MTEPGDGDMRDRLDRLSQDLKARAAAPQAKPEANYTGPNSLGGAMSTGFRVMSELVAAVVIGGLIGWQLDRWLGTSPVLIILFLVLGTAAGFWTVYRIAAKPTRGIGER